MSDEAKKNGCCGGGCCSADWGPTFAFWVLRGWLGVRAVVTGIEKYAGVKVAEGVPWKGPDGKPDPSGALAEGGIPTKFYELKNYHGIPEGLMKKFQKEPMLPEWAMNLFGTALGPLLILTGIATLIGLGQRISLLVQGLIYIMLTVGLILIGQNDGVAWLGIHCGLVALALVLAKHDRLCVCKKW